MKVTVYFNKGFRDVMAGCSMEFDKVWHISDNKDDSMFWIYQEDNKDIGIPLEHILTVYFDKNNNTDEELTKEK